MDTSSLIGSRLGKYEIHAEIGRGGMGAVYKGYDPILARWVAVKVLAPHLMWEKEFIERFLREARAAAQLKHPGIVTIYDVGQEGNWYFFVMEYLEGQALTQYIRQRGPMPLEEVVRLLRPLAEALDYAHQRELIHRDIKPGNVIVGPEGQVALTDFGIVRAVRERRLTATGTIVGTPEYMSPEQAKGLPVGARSDLYSLAVVAYEMLSGRVPFEAESTMALLYKVAHDPPPPLRQARPDLSAEVEEVLERALAKEPDERYATASAFVNALGGVLPERGGATVQEAAWPEVAVPTVGVSAGMPTELMEPEVAAPAPATPPPSAQPVTPGATPAVTPAPARRKRVPGCVWAGLGAVGGVTALILGCIGLTALLAALGESGTPTPAAVAPVATLAPEPTPTNTPQSVGHLLLSDDFDNPSASDIDAAESDEVERYFEGGEFYILVKANELVAWSDVDTWFSDFALETDARFVNVAEGIASIAEEWEYGLYFRSQGSGDFYMYGVSQDGAYRLRKQVDGEWITIVGWTQSPHINTGTDTNRLKVICTGSDIAMYVNDQFLGTATDDSFDAGTVGVFVGTFSEPNVKAAFDNLTVWSVP